MPGSLSTYWKKRDFEVTKEPKGEVAHPGKRLSFVIQKHAASRLHYDFRLELEGTLVSWAVPKGPSLDPAVKRMAVHVEDHPLSYASFEGTIPKGQYGAGTVIVWDRGEWEPVGDPRAGYRSGRLKFDLHGEKLRGRWNLVRIKNREDERQEPWLLIKEDDEEARPASEYDIVEAQPDSVLGKAKRASKEKPRAAEPKKTKSTKRAKKGAPELPPDATPAKLPLFFNPQLATLVEEPPEGEGWIYEVKFDGYRVVARVDGNDVKLFTRNGNDWTARLRTLADEFRKLRVDSAWIDGEIVVLDEKGIPSFQLLQRAFDNANTKNIVYFAFDLPHFAGHDLTRVPLLKRREILAGIFEKNATPRVRYSDHFEGPVKPLLEAACNQGLEGLIGKRATAPYSSTRSTSWVKIKCSKRQEFVVIGHTDPKGSRTGFGSLLLGIHDEKGELTYAGSVGTGFDEKLLRSIKAKLDALATQTPPIKVPKGVKGHWVRPKLVAEVAFTEWTGDGKIRHPVFHGLRSDKAPETITREKAREAPDAADEPPKAKATGKRSAKTKASDAVAGMKVSHGERVIDPSSGLTKLDLVRYYDRIADHMLPHLIGRPSTLVRAPAGIEGQRFFQKHADTMQIPGVREFSQSLWPGHDPMIEIATRDALLGAAQMNVVEFHTSNVTIDRGSKEVADIPDRLIFDLDPGEGVTWQQLLESTALMKQMLDLLELESFLKTSGGKGLHVVVPIEMEWNWDDAKDFSQDVVVHMTRTIPQLFVAKSGASNRVGRIFIDYLRNSFQASTIAAFSARARPGLGVSVPLRWNELEGLKAANQWTIVNVHERLAKLRADPWKDYAKVKQSLTKAAKLLASAKK
jgi:bifunctional non-homologous end joining protein LigD